MVRLLLLLLLLAALLAAPPAPAHTPPGPVTTCQAAGDAYHDYVLEGTTFSVSPFSYTSSVVLGLYVFAVGDGALEPCGPTPLAGWEACRRLRPDHPPVSATACAPEDFPAGYDGELDHGVGGVILAVETGTGSSGAMACYGMTGHHTATIHAQDGATGRGPALTLGADHGRNGQPCGDGTIDPCYPPYPQPRPFPQSLVMDLVDAVTYAVTNGLGLECNPLDCHDGILANLLGPSTLTTGCPPGADGSYHVVVHADWDWPDYPVAGHVWTT